MEWNDYRYTGGQPQAARTVQAKKSVSFTTLIICMLITALLGGGLGSIIALGGQSQAVGSREATQPQLTMGAAQAPQEGAAAAPSVVNAGSGQTYTKKQIVEMTAPSIVGIDVETQVQSRWAGASSIRAGSGSGIIVSSDGYIITNNHVIAGASSVKVYLYDDTEYVATVVATDERTDLAVIKIEAEGLMPVTMGDSDALVVGDDVVAIGNPLGELRGSATSGMVSALQREIEIEGTAMTLLQTDAAINPGNSGGGLFNDKGELVGVINAKIASSEVEGLGFAIPSNDAKAVVEDLMNLGYVSGRARLGIYMEEVALEPENGAGGRDRFGLDSFFGFFGDTGGYTSYETRVRITQVVLGSAADSAGLHAGDLILQVGDTQITTVAQLSNAIGEYKAGDVATIKIQRDTQEMDVSVTFGEYIPE